MRLEHLFHKQVLSAVVILLFGFVSFQFFFDWPLSEDAGQRLGGFVLAWSLFGSLWFGTPALLIGLRERKRAAAQKVDSLKLSHGEKLSLNRIEQECESHELKGRVALLLIIILFALSPVALWFSGLLIEQDKQRFSAAETLMKQINAQYAPIESINKVIEKTSDTLAKAGDKPDGFSAAHKELAKAQADLGRVLAAISSQAESRTKALDEKYVSLLEKELEITRADATFLSKFVTNFGVRVIVGLFFFGAIAVLVRKHSNHALMRAEYVAQLNALLQPSIEPATFIQRKNAFASAETVPQLEYERPHTLLSRFWQRRGRRAAIQSPTSTAPVPGAVPNPGAIGVP